MKLNSSPFIFKQLVILSEAKDLFVNLHTVE